MSSQIRTIASVEIKSLWHKLDLVWHLNPDVNILSGINGSGKSTILNWTAHLITFGGLFQEHQKLLAKITVTFNNGEFISFEKGKVSLKNAKTKTQEEFDYSTRFMDIQTALHSLHKSFEISVISTFDNVIPVLERKPDESINTELDRIIDRLQTEYLDYQLDIGKKKDTIVETETNVKEAINKLRFPQNRFLEIIDNLFKETGKKINRNKNKISFLFDDVEIAPYQLSSGEKQMLVILLTTLVQDNQPSIIFMDEPEISLHFDWQKKLIQYVRELNPNAQIILATHSPAVIMEGWLDKVSEVSDLIVNKKK